MVCMKLHCSTDMPGQHKHGIASAAMVAGLASLPHVQRSSARLLRQNVTWPHSPAADAAVAAGDSDVMQRATAECRALQATLAEWEAMHKSLETIHDQVSPMGL